MSSRCEIKVIENVIYISGRIDDTFRETAEKLPLSGDLHINLKDLISINSSGIREWVVQMTKRKAAAIYLYECTKPLIDQANMVKDFIPANARIMSFYVPYYNEGNESEKNILFVYNKDYTSDQLMPLKPVFDDKGNEMELDVSEAKYFKFIKG